MILLLSKVWSTLPQQFELKGQLQAGCGEGRMPHRPTDRKQGVTQYTFSGVPSFQPFGIAPGR